MPSAGLLFTTSHLLSDTTTTPEIYTHWYDQVHIPDVLAAKDAPPLALRFTNADLSAEFTYLVVFKLLDTSWVGSEALKQVPKHWNGWEEKDGEPKRGIAFANIVPRTYETVQVFEGQDRKPGIGACLITEAMEPAEGTEGEFEDSYQQKHLNMLSSVPGYRCSALFKLLPAYRSSLPLYVALHQFEEPPPSGSLKTVVDIEWSRKMSSGAKAFELNIWKLTTEFGTAKGGESLW